MSLKDKLAEAKKSTKVAVIGGAIVIAGSWGSCQLNLGEESAEPEEAAVEEPAAPEPEPEPELEEKPEAEPAEPEEG